MQDPATKMRTYAKVGETVNAFEDLMLKSNDMKCMFKKSENSPPPWIRKKYWNTCGVHFCQFVHPLITTFYTCARLSRRGTVCYSNHRLYRTGVSAVYTVFAFARENGLPGKM